MLLKSTWEWMSHPALHQSKNWTISLQNISWLEVNIAGGGVSKKLGFCFHWKPHEAGSGRGNCCPLDIEAGRHTTSTDPYPVVEFYSDSKKWHWQRHRHLSVYISLSVSISLKPYSPQLRWLASIFPFFLSPFLECQPQASQSQQ